MRDYKHIQRKSQNRAVSAIASIAITIVLLACVLMALPAAIDAELDARSAQAAAVVQGMSHD